MTGPALSPAHPEAFGHGTHALPARFGSDEGPAHTRRRPTGIILGALGFVTAVTVGAVVQVGAHVGYDEAHAEFSDAVAVAENRQTELSGELESLAVVTAAASTVVSTDGAGLVDASGIDPLATAIAEAETLAAEAEAASAITLPDAGEKPFWAWELFPATAELESDGDEAEEQAEDFRETQDDLREQAAAVEDAGLAVLEAASAAAPAFEAAHVSARNLDVIALRDAAEDVSYYATDLNDDAVQAYVGLTAAAGQVVASEQAELAEKAGPLMAKRLEAEAFARSLAPGVLLEFDWAPIVNGFGTGGGMGGLATWWYGDPGYATIALSDSVAEQWPGEASKALIAHEVGHAISVKCEGMYDDSTSTSIEHWATAWAISMGFHDDANGTWAYGPPPQSYIDLAAGCR